MATTAQQLIQYRRELAEGKLRPDLVDDLIRDAAHTMVEANGLTVLTAQPIRLVICAATTAQAKAWADTHNLPPRQALVAHSVSALRGLSEDFAVATLPGFEDRDDAQQITDVLTAARRA